MLTLFLLTQHIVYQLCWWVVHVSDQSCFFMQDEVTDDVEFTEVEKTLSGMGQLETLVLGIDRDDDDDDAHNEDVSDIDVSLTCGPSVTWCLCVCTYVSKWRSTCWECGLM